MQQRVRSLPELEKLEEKYENLKILAICIDDKYNAFKIEHIRVIGPFLSFVKALTSFIQFYTHMFLMSSCQKVSVHQQVHM